MLGAKRFDRIASRLVASVALLTGSAVGAWAQEPRAVNPTSLPPGAPGGAASTVLIVIFLAAVLTAIVIVVRYVTTRRKRLEEALVLQAQVSDALLRASQLRGLRVTPTARVPIRPARPVTIEVAGEVPTPELRETILGLVRAEVSKGRSSVITEDHLFIVPPMHRAS
jgi:hypothetical protein